MSFFDDPEKQAALERMLAKNAERRQRSVTDLIAWPPERAITETAHGLRIAALMGRMGFPCAYVHVPADHPDNGKYYDDVPCDCHGGLTFVCRSLEGGTWFGWDYGHDMDDTIGYSAEYALVEARRVAAWFAARVAPPHPGREEK